MTIQLLTFALKGSYLHGVSIQHFIMASEKWPVIFFFNFVPIATLTIVISYMGLSDIKPRIWLWVSPWALSGFAPRIMLAAVVQLKYS